MSSGNWLQEHEALAAIIFVTLSITLTGFFAWLERAFLPEKAPLKSVAKSPGSQERPKKKPAIFQAGL